MWFSSRCYLFHSTEQEIILRCETAHGIMNIPKLSKISEMKQFKTLTLVPQTALSYEHASVNNVHHELSYRKFRSPRP